MVKISLADCSECCGPADCNLRQLAPTPMLLLVLIYLSCDVVHPLLQLLVIFLRQRPLVNRIDDILLPV